MAVHDCSCKRAYPAPLYFKALLILLLPLVLLFPAHAEHSERTLKQFGPELSEAIFSIQQDIVAADNPGGYYWEKYQHLEPFYWVNIPVWMRQDRSQRKVHRILDIGCGYGTLLTIATVIYDAPGGEIGRAHV